MLESKYKLPKDRYKYDAPFFGYVYCCNTKPRVDFDPSNPNSKYSVVHIQCPVCDKQVGVIANGRGELPERVGFLYENWNREFQPCDVNEGKLVEPKIDAPEGYRWAALRVNNTYMGGKDSDSLHFILFKTSHSDITGKIMDKRHWIDNDRKLKDLQLLTIENKEIDLTWLCQLRNASIYISESWCTDKTSWYQLNVSFYNTARKHIKRFKELFSNVGISLSFEGERRNDWY